MRRVRLVSAPSRALATAGLVALVAAGALGGCGIADERFGNDTLPPLRPQTAGTVADAPGGSPGTGNTPLIDVGPRTPTIKGDGCRLTGPPPAGAPARITYSFGGSLFELSDDANTAVCLLSLPDKFAKVAPLWSPGGERFLLGAATLMADTKLGASGLNADTVAATWSTPDGEFIAGITKDGRLVRRPVDGSAKLANISFLKTTSAVVYHPSGSVLFAAGAPRRGDPVVMLSSTNGKLFRPLVNLPTGATVTELAASADGESISFVERLGGRDTVRILHFPDLALSTRLEAGTELGDLVQDGEVVAVRVGSCTAATSTRVYTGTSTVDLNAAEPFVGRSNQPVGFVSGQLIVASRSTGCTGPADVWSVDPADPTVPTLLISGVSEASVRPARATPVELPADMKQEPVSG